MSGMLGYEELSELTGRSLGALRVARSKGRLPEPDAPGPKWRRESLAAFLKEGGRAVAASTAAPAATKPPAERTAAAAPSRPPFEGADTEDVRRRSMTLAEILACPHSADDRKVTAYMAMCLRCGRRQQGERFVGAGWAGWSPSLLADCPHPRDERTGRPWGSSCGVCGAAVR